jgi:hypothetical protein
MSAAHIPYAAFRRSAAGLPNRCGNQTAGTVSMAFVLGRLHLNSDPGSSARIVRHKQLPLKPDI